MSLKNRVLSIGLSAAMLMTPAATLAESDYTAGELTTTVISDGYVGGSQINLSAALGMTLDEKTDTDWWKALASLMDRMQVEMSFYDDFGTARIHANVTLDDVTLLTGDALVYEDGSVQMMTNLTGKLVLALPAGSLTAAKNGWTASLTALRARALKMRTLRAILRWSGCKSRCRMSAC